MGVFGFSLDFSLFELLSQYLLSLFHLLLDLFGRQSFGFQFLLEFHALNHNFPFPLVLHNFLIGFPGRSHTSFSFFLKFLQKLFLAVSFLLIQADVGLNVTRSAWASGGLQADTVVHLLYKNYKLSIDVDEEFEDLACSEGVFINLIFKFCDFIGWFSFYFCHSLFYISKLFAFYLYQNIFTYSAERKSPIKACL